MKLKGKYSESSILHAIILAAAAAVSIAVFFVVLNMTGGKMPEKSPEKPEQTTSSAEETAEPADDGDYKADKALVNEMFDAAAALINDNYKVLKLYYTKGLPHKDEPYGNAPEDGYYTVDSDEYTSLGQIEEIVDRTYTEEFAQSIKTNPLGYGAIYKTRDNGTLGIIENYTPMQYDRSWENPNLEIDPVSETECNITVTIHERADDSEVPLTTSMIKTAGGWRFISLIF
jgi:hypothetical protein